MNRLALAAVVLWLAVGTLRAGCSDDPDFERLVEQAAQETDRQLAPEMQRLGLAPKIEWLGYFPNVIHRGARPNASFYEWHEGLTYAATSGIPDSQFYELGILWNGDGTGQIVVRWRR